MRIEFTYFRNAKTKINVFIEAIDLFQLFLILTFFEKWIKYQKIFKNTNDENTTSNNRFWKTIQYYHHRWQFLKKIFFRNFKVFEFEKMKKWMKKMKFQNRNVIHIHAFLWTFKFIEKMIVKNFIRTDFSNSKTKSKFHNLIKQQQIYTCRDDLCKKNLNKNVKICRKHFSIFLSTITHRVDNNLRYNYKRIKKIDRWISFYNAIIFWIWKTHMNIQYCTNVNLTLYVNKYVIKSKSKNLYHNQQNHNFFNDDIFARKMKSMKMMMHFLNYHIFKCSKIVKYLITLRSKKNSLNSNQNFFCDKKKFMMKSLIFFEKTSLKNISKNQSISNSKILFILNITSITNLIT